jgi:hypothetical protein
MKVYWFDYQHPVYPQIHGEFLSYMSAIDLLFNAGERARDYVREGLKNAFRLDDSFLDREAETSATHAPRI